MSRKFCGNSVKTTLALLALLSICLPAAYAAPKNCAAAFLKVPASAEAMGLGGNAVAAGGGMGGAMENPALLGLLEQSEVQSSYGTHLEGYSFLTAAYGRYGRHFNGGLSVTRAAAGDFEGRDAQGAPAGKFSAADMAVSYSAGKRFDQFAGGLTLKYVNSRLENESASAFAADIGAVFVSDKYLDYPYKAGLAVRNIGGRMKYISKSEQLPLMAAAGMVFDMGGGFEPGFSLKGNVPESSLAAGIGLGVKVGRGLTLNGGLSREIGVAEGGSAGRALDINAGLGLRIADLILNYGFMPMGELGNVQRMDLTFKFGAKAADRKVKSKIRKYPALKGGFTF